MLLPACSPQNSPTARGGGAAGQKPKAEQKARKVVKKKAIPKLTGEMLEVGARVGVIEPGPLCVCEAALSEGATHHRLQHSLHAGYGIVCLIGRVQACCKRAVWSCVAVCAWLHVARLCVASHGHTKPIAGGAPPPRRIYIRHDACWTAPPLPPLMTMPGAASHAMPLRAPEA